MHCHHCYAACPAGALTMDGLDASARMPAGIASPEAALALLEHRYSCREYKPEAIAPEKFDLLRRALRAAPTGCNARATRYLLFDTPAKTQALREAIAQSLAKADPDKIRQDPMLRAVALMSRRGLDPILRGAPHVLISAYGEKAPTGLVDSVIGVSHFEFVAQSMGLGTCWCGFIPLMVARVWPDMAESLGLPEGFKVSYAMLCGEKAFDYVRPVSPNPLGGESSR